MLSSGLLRSGLCRLSFRHISVALVGSTVFLFSSFKWAESFQTSSKNKIKKQHSSKNFQLEIMVSKFFFFKILKVFFVFEVFFEGVLLYTGHQTRTECHLPAHVIFLAECSIVCLVSVSHMHNMCTCLMGLTTQVTMECCVRKYICLHT